MWEKEDNMPTVCVPCHDAGRQNVPAMRFVPVKHHGTVPMCETCWGGGQGPGMNWSPRGKPVQQDVSPKNPEVKDLIAKRGHLTEIADRAENEDGEKEDPSPKGKDRYAAMQADRDAGMTVKQIADKYNISVSSVGVYTRVHKNKSAPTPKTATEAVMRAAAATPKGRTDFDALLLDLEEKKQEIEKAIEAVKIVRKLLDLKEGMK
jgi:hypothetical protein